jgi:hypothetical protein
MAACSPRVETPLQAGESSVSDQKPHIVQTGNTIVDHGAPTIFVDDVPICGHYNGIFHISLTAGRHGKVDGKVAVAIEMVAHLRMNRQALESFKLAIANAELIAQPTATKN